MLTLETGWDTLMEKGIRPLIASLDSQECNEAQSSGFSPCVFEHGKTESAHGSSASSSSSKPTPEKKHKLLSPARYVELYTIVYNLSTQRYNSSWPEKLYARHGQVLQSYLTKKVVPCLETHVGTPEFLKKVAHYWENYLLLNTAMRTIFSYLDRFYVKASAVAPLQCRGLDLFRTEVVTTFSQDICRTLLDSINKDRDHQPEYRQTIKTILSMYNSLGSFDWFESNLEKYLFSATEEYYRKKADIWLQTVTFSEYIELVDQSFSEEEELQHDLFNSTTRHKLMAVVRDTLITDRISFLKDMESGFPYLFEHEKRPELIRACKVLRCVESGLSLVAFAFEKYLTDRGCQLLDDHSKKLNNEIAEYQAKEAKNLKTLKQQQLTYVFIVQDVVELHQYAQRFVKECFIDDYAFRSAIRHAFEKCVNRKIGSHPAAAFFSSYCDYVLRSRNPQITDHIEFMLTNFMFLFSFLSDKDFFLHSYKSQLAKRLLTESFFSLDFENLLIFKLKAVCGAHYTARLETMMADYNLSQKTQQDFRSTLSDMARLHKDHSENYLLSEDRFSVMMLSTNNWPAYQIFDLILPRDVQVCLDTFLAYYSKKYDHRKVTWVHHLGAVTLSARFSKNRVYDIHCNTFQACILLLFNDASSLSAASIAERLKLDPITAGKHVASLLVMRILVKKASDPDEYVINQDVEFKNQSVKIPIPVQEEPCNQTKIEEDRSVAIEAAIVRIMKSRKVLHHRDLVAAVLDELSHFKPGARAIQTKIESLIERDFLGRCSDNPLQYLYVA